MQGAIQTSLGLSRQVHVSKNSHTRHSNRMAKTEKAMSLGARERVRTAGQNNNLVGEITTKGFKTYVAALNNVNPTAGRRFQSKNEREPVKFISSFTGNTEEGNDRYDTAHGSHTREKRQMQRFILKKVAPVPEKFDA